MFMQKYLNKVNLVSLLNILVLFILILVLMQKFQYAVIANDDMLDYFINNFKFFHGRFIESAIQSVIIGIIPLKFNLNIQNFSAYTQSLIKSVLIAFMSYALILPFYKFNKKNIYMPIGIIFTFTVFFLYVIKLQFVFGIDVSAFFFGYIMPIPFFSLLWLYLFDFFVQNNISKKRLFYTSLFTLIVSSFNEMYNSVLFIIILLLLIFSLKKKSRTLIKGFFILISIITAMGIIVITNSGFNEVVKGYNLNFVLHLSSIEISRFIYVYLVKLVKDCFILWLPIIIFYITCFTKFKKEEEANKILIYISISLAGFLLFYTFFYFLGETFSYMNYEPYNHFPKFWILHPGLLTIYYMFLLMLDVFIAGYIFNRIQFKTKKFIQICICTFIILLSIITINSVNIAPKFIRETLYKLDKYSVFYFKQGQTAVLSDKNVEYILPLYTNHMPKDLEDKTGNAYKNKIYKDYPYLEYLKKMYKVDTSKGMTFKSEDDARLEFINNGGILSDDELKRLDFSVIK